MGDTTLPLKRRWYWLPWLRSKDWPRLRQLSASTRESVSSSIVEAMRALPIDPNHPHGGLGGIQLAELTHYVITHCIIDILTAICTELLLRPVGDIPWLLRSKDLVMYASGHSRTPAALEYLLSVAPKSLDAVCSARGFNALHEAAFCNKPENVRLLLAARCDASCRSSIGETALHVACHGRTDNSFGIIRQLVLHDDTLLNVTDDSGLLPIDRLLYSEKKRLAIDKGPLKANVQHTLDQAVKLLTSCRDEAAEASSRRVAGDGISYTLKEFVQYYGDGLGLQKWEDATIEDSKGIYVTTRNVDILDQHWQVCTTLPGGKEVKVVEIVKQFADVFGRVPSLGGWMQITSDCERWAKKKGSTLPRCRSCGMCAGKRRTPGGVLFCAVCGAR